MRGAPRCIGKKENISTNIPCHDLHGLSLPLRLLHFDPWPLNDPSLLLVDGHRYRTSLRALLFLASTFLLLSTLLWCKLDALRRHSRWCCEVSGVRREEKRGRESTVPGSSLKNSPVEAQGWTQMLYVGQQMCM